MITSLLHSNFGDQAGFIEEMMDEMFEDMEDEDVEEAADEEVEKVSIFFRNYDRYRRSCC